MVNTKVKASLEVNAKGIGFETLNKKIKALQGNIDESRKKIDRDERKGILTHKQANAKRRQLDDTELKAKRRVIETESKITERAAILESKIYEQKTLNKTKNEIKDSNVAIRNKEKETAQQLKDSKLAEKQGAILGGAKSAGIDVNDYLRGMNRLGFEYNKNNEVTNKAGQTLDDLNITQEEYNRRVVNSARLTVRFQGEMLSTMFAGMALTRALDGIVQSSLDLWGVTELTSAAFDVTMIPVMEKLAPVIYDLLGAFMELPESVQMAIGGIVLFGWEAGKVISSLAMVSLAFPNFGKALSNWVMTSGNLAKAAGIGIKIGASLYMAKEAYDDFKDGDVMAGMGDALAAGGLWVISKNPAAGTAMIGIGATMKFLDDGEFQVGVIKNVMKLGNAVSNMLMASVKYGLSGGLVKPDVSGWAEDLDLISSWRKATEQLSLETGGTGLMGSLFGKDIGIIFPEYTTKPLRDEIDALKLEFKDNQSSDEYISKLEEIRKKYPEQVSAIEDYKVALAGYSGTTRTELLNSLEYVSSYVETADEEMSSLERTWISIHEIRTIHTSDEDDNGSDAKNKTKNSGNNFPIFSTAGINPLAYGKELIDMFVHDAIITPDGIVGTAPDDYIIATKNPESLGGKGGNITMNNTYNINVSDKREFEKILRENNQKLTEDVRRMVIS